MAYMLIRIFDGMHTGYVAGLTSFLVNNVIEVGGSLFQKYCQIDDRLPYEKVGLIFLGTIAIVGGSYYLGNRMAKRIDFQSGKLIFKNVTYLCTVTQLSHIFSQNILSKFIGVCSSGALFGIILKAITLNFEDSDNVITPSDLGEDAFALV
jgi:hypothetical protein